MKGAAATQHSPFRLLPQSLTHLAPTLWVGVTGLLVLGLISPHVTGYMRLATVNFFLLLTGFTLRHKSRKAHATFMSAGMLSDLTLVLILQFQRHAIQTAVSFKLSAWNQAHILSSTLATALYIPMAIIGILLFLQKTPEGSSRKKTLHRRMGWTVLILRTLGFFLMFSMLGRHPT